MPDDIQLEIDGRVAILHMNRAPANAMELGMLARFSETLEQIAADDDLGALIVTGAGDCFCAGLDLKLVPEYSAAQQRELVAALNRLFTQLYGLPCATIAAVNGHALAGGLFLALSCDVRLGQTTKYKLGLPEIRVGVPYPEAAMRLAQAELAPELTRRLVLGGNPLSPTEAREAGILDEIVSERELLPRARELARDRAELSGKLYTRTKRQLRASALSDMNRIVEQGE